MNKVIQLNDKIKSNAAQKAEELRKQKVRAVYKVFQCTQCSSKCERCGAAVVSSERITDSPAPYYFCESCAQEYADYIRKLQGHDHPEAFWHNHQWLKVWQTWIAYQGAVDQYLKSKEFRRLLEDLGDLHPPCD